MNLRPLSCLLASLLLASCGKGPDSYERPSGPTFAAAAPPAATSLPDASMASLPRQETVMPQKLVRTADLQLIVKDVQSAAAETQARAAAAGGYLSSGRTLSAQPPYSQEVVVRVPVARFESVLAELRKLGERIKHESVTSEDVTDQFVDLEARVKSLKTTEEEVRKLLEESRQRSRSLSEILSLHRELTEIRGQVERLQGQMKQIDSVAAYSTIKLTLTQQEATLALTPGWKATDTLHKTTRALLATLHVFTDIAIVLLIYVLPVGLIVGSVSFSGWRAWRFVRGRFLAPGQTA